MDIRSYSTIWLSITIIILMSLLTLDCIYINRVMLQRSHFNILPMKNLKNRRFENNVHYPFMIKKYGRYNFTIDTWANNVNQSIETYLQIFQGGINFVNHTSYYLTIGKIYPYQGYTFINGTWEFSLYPGNYTLYMDEEKITKYFINFSGNITIPENIIPLPGLSNVIKTLKLPVSYKTIVLDESGQYNISILGPFIYTCVIKYRCEPFMSVGSSYKVIHGFPRQRIFYGVIPLHDYSNGLGEKEEYKKTTYVYLGISIILSLALIILIIITIRWCVFIIRDRKRNPSPSEIIME